MPAPAKTLPDTPFDMAPGVVTELPLDIVDFDPDQPRKDFDDDFIGELAADIRARGVRQPITVRPNPEAPGRYIIVFGENRYRASVAAGKETIPALVDDDAGDDPLARLMDQVKENHLRRDLNPIEWANVLRRLRNEHGQKSVTDVVETLKRHGSNIMRLTELPDWAQDLLRRGEISPGHGKLLLTAKPSEAVMAALEENYADDDYRPGVRSLQTDIIRAYRANHAWLNVPWQPPFDYREECIETGCQKMRRISAGDASRHELYCLDEACYDRKCQERQRRDRDRETGQASQPDGDRTNRKPDDDPPHQAPPSQRYTYEYEIANWLRTELKGYVELHPGVQTMLLVLAALDLDFGWRLEETLAEELERAGLRIRDEEEYFDFPALIATQFDGKLQAAAAVGVLRALDNEHLANLALRAEIDIDDWRPDAEYLERYTKAELVDLLIEMGVYDEDDRPRLGKLNADELVERIVEDGDRMETPDELREAWKAFIAPETNEG